MGLDRIRRLGLMLVAVVSLSSVSPGQDVSRSSRGPTSSRPTSRTRPAESVSQPVNNSSSLWTTVIAVSALASSVGALFWWARPLVGGPRSLPLDALELLGRRVVEPKVSVHLIRCGHRVLVVSFSPEGARTLAEITDPAEVQHLLETCRCPRGLPFLRRESGDQTTPHPVPRQTPPPTVLAEGLRRAS